MASSRASGTNPRALGTNPRAVDPLASTDLSVEDLKALPPALYHRTKHWIELRREVRARANGRCESCGEEGKTDTHHLTYERLGEEELEDLMALCRACHQERRGLLSLRFVGSNIVAHDGRIVGRIVSMEIEMDDAWGATLPKGERGANLEGSKDEGSGEKPSKGDGETEIGKVRTVHAYYVEKCDPRLKEMSPSEERILRRAVREAPVDTLIQAIDGLVAYHARRGGNLKLSRVFKTRPGGSPLREQIEWWAEQAPDAVKGRDFVPSEDAAEIQAAKRDVQVGVSFPANAMAQQRRQTAEALLASKGIAARVVDGTRVEFIGPSDD